MNNVRGFRHVPIAVLLAAALVLGAVTVHRYGESWDEADIRLYSEYSINAYAFLLHPADLQPFHTNLNLYGPGYFALAGVFARVLTLVNPAWSEITGWHIINFGTFLGGVLLLYLLALRWMDSSAAFGAALLFMTQPLFWGHAFINPKDIPFLTSFLATIYLGFRMVDGLQGRFQLRPTLVLAALAFGLTISLRVLGPLAGLLVILYAVWKKRSLAIVPLCVYVVLGGVVAYLSWPYLWTAPWRHFVESFSTMADFPFNSRVLFGGRLYKADALPATYIPTILAIQFTESALLLIFVGLIFSVRGLTRGENLTPLLLFVAWFLLPTLAILSLRPPLYDNARQLFFLLPPLFLLAGRGIEGLLRELRRPLLQAPIFLVVALPGILIGARLHPYEYIYYNALVGGTGGAFRVYEMDYWGTSFDQLTRRMNSTLPSGSKVLVYGPEQIVAARARPDIQVFIPREDADPGYDYVVLLTRSNADERLCRKAEVVFAVGRRGAVFSELRRIPPGARCR